MKQINIIGIGMGNKTLTQEALNLLKDTDLLIGSKRLLEELSYLNKPSYDAYLSNDILSILNQTDKSNISILFSGDVVDAPNPKGAVEAYYIGNNVRDLNVNLTLNSFNVSGRDIPFELIIAEGERFENGACSHDATKSNHLIDPNKIITKFNMVFRVYKWSSWICN